MSPPPASWIRKIDITANLEGVVIRGYCLLWREVRRFHAVTPRREGGTAMEEGPEPQEWVERAAEEYHHDHARVPPDGHAPEGATPAPRVSAVTAAVLAVLAALGSLSSGHAANQAILAQSKATNQWAYFQAKSTKGNRSGSRGGVVSLVPCDVE